MIRDDAVYLRHIIDAANRIEEYTSGLDHEGFMLSSLVQDGVIRQIEIIGEATNLSVSERAIRRNPLEGYCRHARQTDPSVFRC